MKELRELEKKCYVIADRLTKPEATPTDTYNVVKELITLIRTATLDEVKEVVIELNPLNPNQLVNHGIGLSLRAIDNLRGNDE